MHCTTIEVTIPLHPADDLYTNVPRISLMRGTLIYDKINLIVAIDQVSIRCDICGFANTQKKHDPPAPRNLSVNNKTIPGIGLMPGIVLFCKEIYRFSDICKRDPVIPELAVLSLRSDEDHLKISPSIYPA